MEAAVGEIGDGAPLYAFGHSMGAAVSLLVEARRPGTFRAIYGFEPIVTPPEIAAPTARIERSVWIEGTRKRRRDFASLDDAVENFSREAAVRRASTRESLLAYLEHGFHRVGRRRPPHQDGPRERGAHVPDEPATRSGTICSGVALPGRGRQRQGPAPSTPSAWTERIAERAAARARRDLRRPRAHGSVRGARAHRGRGAALLRSRSTRTPASCSRLAPASSPRASSSTSRASRSRSSSDTITVSVTRTATPSASTSRAQRLVLLVEHEAVEQTAPRVVARHLDRGHRHAQLAHHLRRRSLERGAGDDRRHRDHRRRGGAHRVLDSGHREDRIDAHERVRRADDDRRRARDRRARPRAPGWGARARHRRSGSPTTSGSQRSRTK